jgi:regulator of replication initiation timing
MNTQTCSSDTTPMERRIRHLAAQVQALSNECERLVVENRRLTIELDDALDREQVYALDPTQERLMVAAVGCTGPGSRSFGWSRTGSSTAR